MEEVDITQEGLHGFLIHWVGNLRDSPDPIWVYLDPTFRNDVSEDVTF